MNVKVLPVEEFPSRVLNSLWRVFTNRLDKAIDRLLKNHNLLGIMRNTIRDLVQL